MKSLLCALLLGAGLASATTASAQTSAPEPPTAPTAPTYQSCPVSGELNKYEIRRFLTIGAISASQAREIRARKRAAQRSENKFLKAQAAQWVSPALSTGTAEQGRRF